MGVIKTVVFDIGNVLLDWNPRYLYRTFFENDAAIDAFLTEIGFAGWNLALDRGRPFAEGNAMLIARFPHYEDEIRAYGERFLETISGPIAGTLAIFEALRENPGIRVCAITNFPRETFDVTAAAYPFLNTFDGIVVSGDTGLVKPEAAIYRYFFKHCAVDPTSAVFIDDKQANVESSIKEGMDAVLFQTPEQLRGDLLNRGLLL